MKKIKNHFFYFVFILTVAIFISCQNLIEKASKQVTSTLYTSAGTEISFSFPNDKEKMTVNFSLKLAEGDKGTLNELVNISGEFQKDFCNGCIGPQQNHRYYFFQDSYSVGIDFNLKYELTKVEISVLDDTYATENEKSTTLEKFSATKPAATK